MIIAVGTKIIEKDFGLFIWKQSARETKTISNSRKEFSTLTALLHFYPSKELREASILVGHLRVRPRIVAEGRGRWILFYSQRGGTASGILRVEYVSYHHRGVARHLLPIHNAWSRCGSHFEYILTRGELSPKRFDFPFKGSYIYTCWGGRGGEVSIEELARGWRCLKILADCQPPRRAPSVHPFTLKRIYVYLPYLRGKLYPLSCYPRTFPFVYPAWNRIYLAEIIPDIMVKCLCFLS